MIKFINIIKLSGEYHACPKLHDTEEAAVKDMEATLGKYKTPHLKFVTMPIPVELPDEKEGD